MRMARLTLIGLAVAAVAGAEEPPAVAPSKAPTAAAPAVQAKAEGPEGRVVHTFKDEQELQRFVGLWQQRQGVLVRINVLQAYLGEEQAGLAELERTLTEAYHLNLAALDRTAIDLDRRVILERPEPRPLQESPPPAAPEKAP